MLDAHPQLTIPPETWFLPALLEARRSEGRLTPDQVIEILTSERRWEDFGIDAEKLRERFGDAEFVSPRRAARSFFKIYAQQQGKPRWGDKTPEYVSHMASISRALPEARFIHLIRDGRAVFRSRVNRREVKATREALLWSRLIGRARRQAQRVEHYMEVRYEDLVLDPERQLREICDFVELDFQPAMLRYHESAEDRLGEIYRDLPSSNQPGLTAAERRALHRHTVEAPNPDLIERWRTTLTADQIADYEANAGATLVALGYELLTGDMDTESGSKGIPGNVPKHRELGLTDSEFALICEQLGREPNDVELAMFSLLWSEHCAYKHSRKLLRRLPTEGPRVVMGPGENAGAVDVGSGYAVAFKVESHNHPSAVEPFQGAATGVGGILRDVFALGARPIAILDSLRFGELSSERSRYLFDHVVAGIGHYGNSIGVPTVGGEVYFEPPYEQNCLVNAMCVGLARTEDMIRSAAAGVGNVVVLMGASTGRDGIGGASVLASAELGEGDEGKRPTVQIGDPFEESKLVECCLELLGEGLLVSLQDLGAAGLTSSAAEMAAGGGTGIDIDVARVPLREADMEPFEVMVSESQERMLAVVEPAQVERVIALCEKWQVGPAVVGEVTDNGLFRVLRGADVVGEMPIAALVDGCPLYDLDPAEPEGWIYGNESTLAAEAEEPADLLAALLGSPSIASKRWAFEQYDPVVGSRTVRRPEAADAAVLNLPEARTAIAVAIDGNGRRVACDPYRGATEAVLECAQNLACVGAAPLGLTNCLNFGNPEKPTVAWQLDRAIQGLADTCSVLGVPVVGGNVSLYNETGSGPIYPTPVVGLVGELPDPARAAGLALVEGQAIALAGPFAPSLAGSELAKIRGELSAGLPGVDLAAHAAAQAFVRDAVRAGRVAAAHDVSDGGLACAVAEMAIAGGVGARADLDGLIEARGCSGETACFGEGPGGYLLAGDAAALDELARDAMAAAVDLWVIGAAGGEAVEITAAEAEIALPLARAEEAWDALSRLMERVTVA